MRTILTAICVTVLAAAITRAQGPRPAATPLPKVTGPVAITANSRPFLTSADGLPPIDLGRLGYVEQEFLVSGAANVYDWAADGSLNVRTPNAPYTTRILVRRPSNAARFSGAVIVEPLFPARRWDWSMMWGYSHDHFIEHGDAWVGVTLPASAAGLQKFNAARYASLSFKNPAPDVSCATGRGAATTSDVEEGLRWDMLSQVGALLKASGAGRPLNGLRVQALYLTSQGGDLTTYMNAIHSRARLDNDKPVYDGYLAKAPFNAARINQCAAAPAPNDPRQAVRNIGVPVIAVAAQGEVLATYAYRRLDSDDPIDRYRLYEVSGAGHIDKFAYVGFPPMRDQEAAGNAQGTPEFPFAARCEPDIPLMDTPIMSVAFDAAFANLDQWTRKGVPAPKAPRLAVRNAGPEVGLLGFLSDEFGHGVGGFRTPYVEVPLAAYATNSPGPGNCREMGHTAPFDNARMTSLYGSDQSYRTKLGQAVDRLVKDRWLTDGDAKRIKAAAR